MALEPNLLTTFKCLPLLNQGCQLTYKVLNLGLPVSEDSHKNGLFVTKSDSFS